MAEFAARSWRFAIQVKVRVADGEHFGRFWRFADQVEHRGTADSERRAQWKAHDRAKMIFELAGQRAFDRPVSGVVNARRHFVGEEFSVLLEKLDGEDSHVLQFVEHRASGLLGGAFGSAATSVRMASAA